MTGLAFLPGNDGVLESTGFGEEENFLFRRRIGCRREIDGHDEASESAESKGQGKFFHDPCGIHCRILLGHLILPHNPVIMSNSPSETVVVLGASDQPDRYSNKAVKMLLEHGHRVIPIHPALKTVEGIAVVPNLSSVSETVNTLTLYLGPDR